MSVQAHHSSCVGIVPVSDAAVTCLHMVSWGFEAAQAIVPAPLDVSTGTGEDMLWFVPIMVWLVLCCSLSELKPK